MIRLAIALLTIPVSTHAQGICFPRDITMKHFIEAHKQTPQSIGLGTNDGLYETFASETGSWTITITMPTGLTCLVASGESFERMTEILPPPGVPG